MSEDLLLHRLVSAAEGDDPSPTFVAALRVEFEAELMDARVARPGSHPNEPTLVEPLPEEDKEMPKSRLVIGGLAAASVVALVAVFAVVDVGGDDTPDRADAPAEQAPATPVETAQAFFEARAARDGEAVRALVADDAVIDEIAQSPDDYIALAEFDQATGRHERVDACNEVSPGPPSEVICTYTFESAWSQALGVGPFSGSSTRMLIQEERIVELTQDFVTEEFEPQVWTVFRSWMRGNHSGDYGTIIDSGSFDIPRITPEAITLWEQYTAEFVEWARART